MVFIEFFQLLILPFFVCIIVIAYFPYHQGKSHMLLIISYTCYKHESQEKKKIRFLAYLINSSCPMYISSRTFNIGVIKTPSPVPLAPWSSPLLRCISESWDCTPPSAKVYKNSYICSLKGSPDLMAIVVRAWIATIRTCVPMKHKHLGGKLYKLYSS